MVVKVLIRAVRFMVVVVVMMRTHDQVPETQFMAVFMLVRVGEHMEARNRTRRDPGEGTENYYPCQDASHELDQSREDPVEQGECSLRKSAVTVAGPRIAHRNFPVVGGFPPGPSRHGWSSFTLSARLNSQFSVTLITVRIATTIPSA